MGSWLHARLRTHWPAAIFMLLAVLAFALVGVWVGQAGAIPGGWLENQGFEEFENIDGDWDPLDWIENEPVPGAVAVVGAKDWERFKDTYQTMGVPAHDPDSEQYFLADGGGSTMLRLGVPKNKDSHQIKGPVAVSQEFVSDGTRDIYLVYRIFTWEHRSEDTFVVEVRQPGNPEPVYQDIVTPDEPVKPSKSTYSDWSEIAITGLPGTVEEPQTLILSYTLSNVQNAAHDTWVYVDHVNHPPVARFKWAPGPSVTELPHEGDVIGLYGDQSYDPDPDGSVVKWKWEITKDGQTVSYNDVEPLGDDGPNDYLSPVGFIVPHDEGQYYVKLTVWDNEGLSDSTGQVPSEGDPPTFVVQNYAPRVNALNIEVLPGGTSQLVGRFVDPGWEDEHTAVWSPDADGSSKPGELPEEEYRSAPVSSGYVGGTFDEATDALGTWTLTVEDGDGGVGSDKFMISVISSDPNRFETEDTFPNVRELDGDGAYLSYIQSQGDIDIFEVLSPDGDLLPMGTEVLVTLRDLPADYDLVVFEGVGGSVVGDTESPQAAPFTKSQFQAAGFMHSGFMQSGFMHSAFMNSGFMHSAFMHSGFMHSPFIETGFMHSGFMQSGFMHSAFMHSPFADAAFMHSGFMHSGFMQSAFMHSGFMHSGFMHSPTPIDGYPLSDMNFTGAENDNTGGTDISFDELGFDLEALPQDQVQNLRVLGFSANSGTESEVVLATAGYPSTGAVDGHVYVAVKSATEAYSSSSPYTLQIETSSPADTYAFTDADRQEPLVGSSQSWPITPPPSSPLTLFVTQLDRLKSLYTPDATAEDSLNGGNIVLGALESIRDSSAEGLVRGKVVNLPAHIYDDWDREPWRVDLANEVSQQIRLVIQDELAENSDIKYVVLVGNDRIIPFRRVIDQTIIGNEQNYPDQSFLTHFRYEDGRLVPRPSATLASIANGYILTDDYYVDEAPISWGGSYLYIPDLAVSRLVETPEEIAGTIQAFTDPEVNGTLSPTVGLVSGYDFMTDGAQNVSRILTDAGLPTPTELIGEEWSGDALRAGLLADEDAANINAHFTHFAGLSPKGYAASLEGTLDDEGELLLSSDIVDGSAGSFLGRLVFSMGCHAGLNVADEEVVELSPESPITPALDFPQAMMQQGGIYLGSTGFGYGDTVGIAGTEALIGFFAEQLVGGTDLAPAASVGLALAQAKQEYLGSLTSLTPYDQKSSVQFTLYGMPQYHLPGGSLAAQAASTSSGSLAAASVPGGPDVFTLYLSEWSLEDGGWSSVGDEERRDYALSLETADTGQYITANGKSGAIPDRPIHPVAPFDLNDLELVTGPAHGFVYTGGFYSNLPADPAGPLFQPAIARVTTEWELGFGEFQVATSEFWPVEPGVLTTRETANNNEYDQTFVAVPAQFKPTPGTDPIEGTERVWSSLDVEVLTSADTDDWLAPTVSDVDLWLDEHGLLNVSVEADDSSGISRIVVLQMDPGQMRMVGDGSPTISGDGRYELAGLDYGPTDPKDLALLIQVVDGEGNVTRLTGRGALFGLRQPFNLGFEFGLNYWEVTEPVDGNASVVPASGDATGYWMLQLGTPTDKDSHQVKGITSVSQQFVADGGDINLVYLLQSDDTRDWEFDDEFTISVADENGNITYWVEVRNTQVTNEWEPVAITGLTAGKPYTLTYTLDTTNSAAKNTWVYVDQGS